MGFHLPQIVNNFLFICKLKLSNFLNFTAFSIFRAGTFLNIRKLLIVKTKLVRVRFAIVKDFFQITYLFVKIFGGTFWFHTRLEEWLL